MLHMKKPNSLLKKMVGLRFLMAFCDTIGRISKEKWDFDTACYLTIFLMQIAQISRMGK